MRVPALDPAELRELRQTRALNRRSEAQAQTWVERLLEAFGRNPSDPRQVVQEYLPASRR
jgi:hypothetical protein